MKIFFKFTFISLLYLFATNSHAANDLQIIKAEVTGRSVILNNNLEKARRLALEDALYLASLKGGAIVEGFSSVSSNTIINDQSIIKTNSKILDFKILSQKNVNEHFEVKILAIIGSKKNNKECKPKPINLSIFSPKISYNHSLPSKVIRSMFEWNKFFLNSLINNEQIQIRFFENLDLDSTINSFKNTNFDYSASINEMPVIKHGDYIVAPKFILEPIRKYKNTESGYNLSNYQIKLEFLKGPNFNFFKKTNISKDFQINFPTRFQFISAIAGKSVNEMSEDVNNAILLGIKKMIKEFDCEPIQAVVNFKNNSLFVNLGSRNGLKNRQIGIIENNFNIEKFQKTNTTILFISEINNNLSKLEPLDDNIDLSKLNQMIIKFIE